MCIGVWAGLGCIQYFVADLYLAFIRACALPYNNNNNNVGGVHVFS